MKIFFNDIVKLYEETNPVKIKQILNGETPVVETDKTKVAHILAGKVLEYRESKQLTETEYKNVLKVIFDLDNDFEALLGYYEETAILAIKQILSNPKYELPIKDNQFFNKILVGKFMEYFENHTYGHEMDDEQTDKTDIKPAQIDNLLKFTYQLDDESAVLIIKKANMNYSIRSMMLCTKKWAKWAKVYKHIVIYNKPCREDITIAFEKNVIKKCKNQLFTLARKILHQLFTLARKILQ